MVRDLLARVGAPPAALEAAPDAEASHAEAPAAPQAGDARAAESRENARAAMRKAMGLPPLPSLPAPPIVPNSGISPLAPGRNRSAPAASCRPWRSEVAARIVAQRARGRCECTGEGTYGCGAAHPKGPAGWSGDRCAVRQGDAITGPRDFPAERRVAVLLCEPTPAASWRGTIEESELTVRCTECSERFSARALRASAPVRAGGRGGRTAASGRGASAGGDDADVFAD
jgi:hypothetical protein